MGGPVVGLAVGWLAVPLQAALALGLWEEGWSLLEALWTKCLEARKTDEDEAVVSPGKPRNSGRKVCQA